MNARPSGWPHPTTTWPWISRSSMRYSSTATAAPDHRDARASLVGRTLGAHLRAFVALEHEVEQRGEVGAGDERRAGLLAQYAPRGDRAAAGGQVGEDHAGAA